jgi:molecular chaperone GrpE
VSDVETKPDGDDPEATGEEAAAQESADPVADVAAERDRLKDQLLRVAADFDNFRKRTRKDLEQAERRGKEDVLRELLPVFDNLERAVQAAKGSGGPETSAIIQGIEMVLKLFEDAAQRIGIERIPAVGERFDPSIHDAFQQRETDEHPPGTILAEYQAGYRLGERLLRPAAVVVARKPQGESAS